MTVTRLGALGVLAGALLTAQCAAPALAVAPPPVDDALLPPPAPPAPAQPTEQHGPCTAPLAAGPGAKPQLAGLDTAEIWRLTRGAGQRVAVIDTGVAPHPRLPGVIGGGDYVSGGDGRQDCDGHGTIVAGIIAAAPDSDDGSGFSGLAPEATVISIRQSSTRFGPAADPSSHGVGDVTTLAAAVRTAADMGASVINISSVACSESTLDDRALGAALRYAVDVRDAVVVAAAGNVGGAGQCPEQNLAGRSTVIASPAWYDDYVLAVGSVGPTGEPSPFTLNGPWVDVAAPGENVVSLDPDGSGVVGSTPGPAGPAPLAGTSYAAPILSAVAALVRARFPRLTARQVMARIEQTAHEPPGGWNPAVGNGTVDPLAAVSEQIAKPTAPKPDPTTTDGTRTPSTDRPRTAAAAGAAVCLAVVAALAASGLRRLGGHRPARDVPGDQRGRSAQLRPGG